MEKNSKHGTDPGTYGNLMPYFYLGKIYRYTNPYIQKRVYLFLYLFM